MKREVLYVYMFGVGGRRIFASKVTNPAVIAYYKANADKYELSDKPLKHARTVYDN